jgi:Mg2+/Co2+ transporter CorC
MAAEKERLIRGEPSERINILELVRQENAQLLVDENEGDDSGEAPVEAGPVS